MRHTPPPVPLLSFHSSFIAGAKLIILPEEGFSCVTKKLAGGSRQFIDIQEEVDFLLYEHLRIRL